jgi:hypothetical protein
VGPRVSVFLWMRLSVRGEFAVCRACSEWYVIINTRWNVVAKEGLFIHILSSYTQQDAFTQSKAKYKRWYCPFFITKRVCWAERLGLTGVS